MNKYFDKRIFVLVLAAGVGYYIGKSGITVEVKKRGSNNG